MTYAAKRWREVPAKDYLPYIAAKIHPALVIAPPNTPLGEFSLAFLQNADKETLRAIYDECDFQRSNRVSLCFCKKSSMSHAKPELDDKTIKGLDPKAPSIVLRYSSPEYSHGTSYHYVSIVL